MFSQSGGDRGPWDAQEPGRDVTFDECFGDNTSTAREVGFVSSLGDVAAGDAWGLHMSADSSLGPLPGDFYVEQDNVKRGVAQATHGVADGFGAVGSSQGREAYGGDVWGMGMDCNLGNKIAALEGLGAPTLARGFSAVGGKSTENVPEHVDFRASVSSPAEVPFGGLSATSMTLASTNAAEVANVAYGFLITRVISEIRKVRIEKFAINAEVFCNQTADVPGRGSCTLKVRVFRPQEEGELMAEFRRQGGDAVVFAQVFDQALRYIQNAYGDRFIRRNAAETCVANCGALAMAPGQLDYSSTDGDTPDSDAFGFDPYAELQPLVDALTLTASSSQAEAVSALSTLASVSTAGAVAICTALAGVQGILAGFINSARLDIAYPAAQLASKLARHGSFGMAEPLLHSALQCVAADGTDKLVRLELAEAVKTAAQRVGSELAPSFNPMYSELRGKVPQVLSMPAAKQEAAVAMRLAEALGALEAVEPFPN